MFRKVLLGVFLAAAFYLTVSAVYAQEQFAVDVSVEYKISSDATTTVTHNVTLENLYSEYYAKSYSLTLANIKPVNIRVYNEKGEVPFEVQNSGHETTIKAEFTDPAVGKNVRNNFSISFEEKSLVTKTGEVWEVTIPRLGESESFRAYSVVLLVPETFGQEAYLSPAPESVIKTGGYTRYVFGKAEVQKVGVSAGFGEFQVFSFTLNYHLENPLGRPAEATIALPPDTAFQKVYYEKAEPKPQNVTEDSDGNWIAKYLLTPRQRLDIVYSGHVQLFASPREDLGVPTQETLAVNTAPSKYWQSDDPEIIALAQKLKTPRAIYEYVVNILSYDYARVAPNIERLGAKAALLSPDNAICMEFTDLFVALSRAAGIPAREVDGYAYTENPEIEPLSLVADVLHAWPEYWDSARSAWIPVDPTWGSTTGGVNFFDKLDLRHFAFVIHGTDSEKPYPAGSYKLGSEPQKDVFVAFDQLPKERTPRPQIFAKVNSAIPLFPPQITISVENTGTAALYNSSVGIYYDGKRMSEQSLDSLLPFGNYQTEVKIPNSIFAINMPEKIKVVVGDNTVDVPTGKEHVVIFNLIVAFAVIILLVIIVLIRLKKIKLPHGLLKKQKENPLPEGQH